MREVLAIFLVDGVLSTGSRTVLKLTLLRSSGRLTRMSSWTAMASPASSLRERTIGWLCLPDFFLDGEHWTVVCFDTNKHTIIYLDPTGLCRQSVTKIFGQLTKLVGGTNYRTQYHQPFTHQLDNYKCDIFTMMLFVSLACARVFPAVDRDLFLFARCSCLCLGL